MPYTQLTADERETIAQLRAAGEKIVTIARLLGRHSSSVSRELRRNGSLKQYSAMQADRKARKRRKQAKLPWKFNHAPLKAFVVEKLKLKWSPEQIAGQLQRLHSTDPRMQVSATTIYHWIRGNKQQGGELHKHLRQARKKRRKRYGTGLSRCKIVERVSVRERPVSADRRSHFGHWESDTLEGKKGTGYLVTHVERKTGYLIASYLPNKQAETLNSTTVELFRKIPSRLIKTLTTDNGSEFSHHQELSRILKCSIYFADPHSPWQRGQNENTNGLLRQYFPKGSDLSQLKPEQVSQAIHDLNHRPRKKYGYKSPHQLLHKKIIALQN